jgi:hypothetical protein
VPGAERVAQPTLKASFEDIPAARFDDINDLFAGSYKFPRFSSSFALKV